MNTTGGPNLNTNPRRQLEGQEMYQTGLNHAFLAPEVPLAIKKELGRAGDDGQMKLR